ncbi:MAG: hypothetical protein F6K65_21625 [Moorea sp. SIO3C2]|nr:hypothetical protein [Moorena sp. SIO3C2]
MLYLGFTSVNLVGCSFGAATRLTLAFGPRYANGHACSVAYGESVAYGQTEDVTSES